MSASTRRYPGFESPEPALNQAVAWAIRRAGGHLRADPASRHDLEWAGSEFAELLDTARRWQRIRGSGVLEPEEFLAQVVGGLWGARIDGVGGRLQLAPYLPPGWKGMSLRRLRAYRTVLDLDVRPRAEWVTVRIAVVFGPSLALELRVRNTATIARATVDEVPLAGPRVVFTVGLEHEVVFFFGA